MPIVFTFLLFLSFIFKFFRKSPILHCNIIYVVHPIRSTSVPVIALSASLQDSHLPIFIIDSGCSQPMCKDRRYFTSLVYDKTPVHLANGQVIYTAGKGSIGGFHDIYFVPDLDHNLLSVSYLNHLGYNVQFLADGRVSMHHVTNTSSAVIGLHSSLNGLFQTTSDLFTIHNFTPDESSLRPILQSNVAKTRTQAYSNNLWHQRLCHINDSYASCARTNALVSGCDFHSISNRDFCESCAMTKSHYVSSSQTPGSRHSKKQRTQAVPTSSNSSPTSGTTPTATPSSPALPTSSTHSTPINPIHAEDDLTLLPFQKFACDLKGPLPASINNNKYALIFTCLRTRYRFAYFLKKKEETFAHTKNFIHHVRILKKNVSEIIFDRSQYSEADIQNDSKLTKLLTESNISHVCELKSDNGGEFTSQEFETMLLDADINHQTTAPHTPHQNGVAERSNRTVFEAAAAILHASNMSVQFWTYAVKQVIHTQNMMPNKRLGLASTPYIEVFHRIPDISYLRTFGCHAYLRVPDNKQPALGLRAVKGTMIGYDHPRSLSYLIYYKGKIYKSHHVTFNEDLSTKLSTKEPTQLEQDINELLSSSEQVEVDYETADNPPNDPVIASIPTVNSSVDQSSSSYNPLDTGPSRSTRAQLNRYPVEALYSNLSKVSLSDGQSAILSGKYFDPDDEYLLQAERILMSCGAVPEEEVKTTAEADKWSEAMQSEIFKLSEINTWDIISYLPEGCRALRHKWVLKNKFDIFGNYIYKARLTVKGCNQREGFDFDETFSPVAHLSSIRLLLSLATAEHMHIWQLDVANAFANAHLTDDVKVYMHPPPEMNLPPGSFLKLNRALYGLKQSSREWNMLLSKTLIGLGFKQLISDSCIYVGIRNGEKILISVYVDDLLVASRDSTNIEWIQSALSSQFKTNATVLNKVVGFSTQYNPQSGNMTLSKDDYTMQTVNKFSEYISSIPYRTTPLDHGVKLSRQQCPTTDIEKTRMAQLPYRQLLGALNYLSVSIRSDITFSIHYLARLLATVT